jgi:Ca2+-binding RTX toxin-like protein
MKRLPALIAIVATALFLAPLATAAPANDNFVSATAISGANGSQVGNNLSATKEVGEPAHAGNTGGRSIWFTWTAPEDGVYVFDTLPSSFDTTLAVYSGSGVDTLTEVASNDDAPGLESSRSLMVFSASKDMVYAVAVDGFGGKGGRVVLRWRHGVSNDLFDSAQALTGQVGSHGGTNVNATIELDEPSPAALGASVWYEWTAPANGIVKFSTRGSRFDTALAVYTGTNVASLTEVASNDDDPQLGCCSSFVGFEAVAGSSYRVAVGGFSWDQGSFTLSWSPFIIGTSRNDILVGTPGVEEIRGLGGNDMIRALGASDVIVGGPGDDRSVGGPGNDNIIDIRGHDVLLGGSGIDVLYAQDSRGGDVMYGGPGRDTCRGDVRDVRRAC